jgi:hypothetical protein
MTTKAKTEKDYLKPLLDEVRAEREYQTKKWGNFADDSINLPHHWSSYIGRYSTNWMNGTWAPHTKETVDAFRKSMIKTAAIALAAVESVDRQRAEGQKAFFEKQ